MRDYLAQVDPAVDLIQVNRFNVALTAQGPLAPFPLPPECYADVWMYPQPLVDYRRSVEEAGVPWIRGVPAPKVVARPHRLEWVGLGFHDGGGQNLHQIKVLDLVVAHLAFTTEARFVKKIKNIQHSLATFPGNLPAESGWHWRRWAKLLDSPQAVTAEYQYQQITDEQRHQLSQQGQLVSAAAYLRRGQSQRLDV